MDIKEILENLGYTLSRENHQFYRAKPIYRPSSNNTSLRICRKTGKFWDFGGDIKGSLEDLVALTLNLKSTEEAEEYLSKRGMVFERTVSRPRLNMTQKYDMSMLDRLMPIYDFYTKKKEGAKISEALLIKLKCGLAMSGKLNNRIVFPIFDMDGFNIEGFAGRDLLERDTKWKLMGAKRLWVYPFFLPEVQEAIMKKQEVILVESIGDFLALYESGIYNVLVLFGVKISGKLVNFLSCLPLKRIIIALNNDCEKGDGNVGELATKTIRSKLEKLNSPEKIWDKLAPNNDFGESMPTEIKSWYEELHLRP